MNKRTIRIYRAMAALILMLLPLLMGLVPYNTYNFGPAGGEVLPMQACMTPRRVVTGADLGVGALSRPQDFRFGKDGLIYLADTGNNRVLLLDVQMNHIKSIDGFYNNGEWETFNSPEGIYAEEDGTLFIADTQNRRIVKLGPDGALVTLMDNVELTGSSITFRPQKVVSDPAGHVYIVGAGSTEGLIQLTREGTFVRFFGSNRVRPNPIEVIYRLFLTRAQRQAREQFVPTEFSNIHVDATGFIYVTTRNARNQQVRRLNALGGDVLKHDGISEDVFGDVTTTPSRLGTPAQFQSVTTDPDGNVYALDNSTGRVFVYDSTGQMMFMFGGRGNQAGLFADPQAVEVNDGLAYVLCSGRGSITVFELTDYGATMLLANHLYTLGEYEQSIGPWEKLIRMDSGNPIAWQALGQAYYGRGDYAAAMEYFRLGQNRKGYSMAFSQLRDEWIKRNFSILVLSIVIAVAALNTGVRLARKNGRRRGAI